MKTIFIDANVIADWFLIKDASDKIDELREDKILHDRLKNISYSYTLVEALMIETEGYHTVSSNLALAETFSIFFNEITCFKMYKLGIPLTMWSRRKAKQVLTDEEKYYAKESILNYLNILKKYFEIVDDIMDDEIYPKLVLDYGLRTHDALLLTTAICKKCSWFITRDADITNLRRKKGFSDTFGITPDLPQNFLRVVEHE